jgi:hypothetical protein
MVNGNSPFAPPLPAGYNQCMRENPYRAPDIPSDAPRDEPRPVVIPSWIVETAVIIAIVGTLIALFGPALMSGAAAFGPH